MAATRRTAQGLAEAEHLEPEIALCAAVLRQLMKDVRSPRHEIRAEAVDFLADTASVGFWADTLGLERDDLAHGLRAALRQAGPR